MAFSSFSFILFAAVVWGLFHITPDRLKWLSLLVASFVFYSSLQAPYLLIVLAATAIVSYGMALLIHQKPEGSTRFLLLWGGIGFNIIVLATLKYLPASSALFSAFSPADEPGKTLLISIGVSYFTFQAISYLVDVYLELIEPEEHLGYFTLYLAFFPKLLQGPIERGADLLPQLRRTTYQFDYELARSGALLFVWGMFKKVVVADRLALSVNAVYNDVHAYSGVALIVATVLYALQLYLDFSGYTDMAIGVGRLFGIELTNNFNSPYRATSIADFWRRWHISFSRWILDYIFKPLQMTWRNAGTAGAAAALLVTFLVSGVWHGASWGFIVWGLLHGIYMAAAVYYRPYQKKFHALLGLQKGPLKTVLQTCCTFALVCFAWIFFRANSIGDALYIVRHLADVSTSTKSLADQVLLGRSAQDLLIVALGVTIVSAGPRLYHLLDLFKRPFFVRWAYYAGVVLVIVFGGVQGKSTFIYFQF